MSELLIFDPADNLLAVLSNEAEGACDFWSAPFREVVNNGSFFEFIAKGDHEDSQYLVAENQVAFEDKDGYFRLFVIKEPDQTHGINGPQIHCICEPAMNELNEELIEDVRPYNTTLADAQSRALAGTRWRPGISAELGINSTNYYYISVNEAIQENINTWGGELRDRIEIKDNKIIGRYIDILPRRGQDTGKLWEIDKDILSLSYKVQSYPKTALYGRGASLETENGGFTRKITFADIEWKKSNGDPVDKPKGQEWVGDPEALSAFGRLNEDGTKRHRKGIYENGEQEDPAALLRETWEALQQQKHQFHNYEMDVFLLEEISGYEHEKVRLGDTTIAIDRSFTNPIEIEERVISYEYDVSDPDNTGKIELGQFIDLYSDNDRLDQIESKLNDGINIWNNAGSPVSDDDIENITPPKTLNVIASGGFQNILVEWAFVSAIYIANYEVYASQIQGFTPDSSNLVFRGKSSTYGHQAETNQQWYFRVRAINTHGVPGEFSEEAMAQTARVISDDILFGPEIAEKLRELSETAGILADGSVDLEQIKQDALDAIQAQATQYTDAEILATEQAIMTDLNLRIGNVNSDISSLRLAVDEDIATLNSTANDLMQRVSDNEIELAVAGGKITTIEQNINTIDGSLSTTISQLSNLDGVVSQQQTTITAMAGEISAKAEKTEVYTKIEADGKINTAVSAAKAEIKLTTDGLRTDVTAVTNQVENMQIGSKNLLKKSNVPVSTSNYAIQDYYFTEPMVNGETYTVTIKGTLADTKSYFAVYNSGGSGAGSLGRLYPVDGQTGLFRATITGKVADSNTFLRVYHSPSGASGTSTIDWIMLVKGNKTTEGWTPAPEDVDGAISAVQSYASSIDQKADSIQLSVTSLSQTIDSQGTRIESAESSITQLSNSISLKANAADVYTKSQVDTALNGKISTTTYNNKMSQLDISISGISGRVSNTEASINDLTGEVTSAKSQIASLDIKADGIATSVSEVRADLTSLENNTGNLVNNPAVSGTADRWTGTGLTVVNQDFMGVSTPVLQSSRSADTQNYFDYFEVDPSKAYQVSGWLKKSEAVGAIYLGANALDGSGNLITIDTVRNSTGALASTTNNPYFWHAINSLVPTEWVYVCVYIMPAGTELSDMKNIGVIPPYNSYENNMRMHPNTRKMRIRFLNWSNSGVERKVWFANPKVVEVDPNAVLKGTQAGNAADALNSRVSSAETRIDQNATQIGLKASQTSVDSLTGRMSKAESSINLMTDEISLKVNSNDVIAAINLQPGTVKIKAGLIDLVGDVYITNGQTQITNLAVGTAAIANAAITNAKIGTLAVGTGQIQDAAITNAKIANASIDDAKISSVSANKITAGIIDGVTIKGSTFISSNNAGTWTVEGAFAKFNNSSGSLQVSPAGVYFYNSNGSLRYQMDSSVVNSAALGTSNNNVYLASNNETRSVHYSSIPGSGNISDYTYTPVRASGFYGNFWNINPAVTATHLYARPLSGGELRITLNGTTDIYNNLRAAGLLANTLTVNSLAGASSNLFLRPLSGGEVRITLADTTDNYQSVRASGYYGNFIDKGTDPGVHLYVRPEGTTGELQVTVRGTTDTYRPVRALSHYGNLLEVNTATHLYLRPASTGEVRVTAAGTTGTYQPIRADEFRPPNSTRESKKDIEKFEGLVLDDYRQSNVYTYLYKNEDSNLKKRIGVMLDEVPKHIHARSGDTIDLYSMAGYLWKGIKDVISVTDNHADDINWLNIENQYLKQKVNTLEQRVKILEDRLDAA